MRAMVTFGRGEIGMAESDVATPVRGVEITESAARRIAWLQSQEEHKGLMLRVSVSGGG